MIDTLQRLVDQLEPGQTIDFDTVRTEHGQEAVNWLSDELSGRGWIFDTRNRACQIDDCMRCRGDGEWKGRTCSGCEGTGMTIDNGKGQKPYHG